jgi:hypothetical protein
MDNSTNAQSIGYVNKGIIQGELKAIDAYLDQIFQKVVHVEKYIVRIRTRLQIEDVIAEIEKSTEEAAPPVGPGQTGVVE